MDALAAKELETEILAQRLNCDMIVATCANLMFTEHHASLALIIDRFLTYCAAQACAADGKVAAAAAFRQIADKIEGGIFDHIEAKGMVTLGSC